MYDKKKMLFNVIIGIAVLLLASLFYIGRWRESILLMFDPVLHGFIQTGEGAGTFVNFFTYQFSILPILPFAFLGLFYFIKKRDFNILTIWAILNLAIVYFQFFFFNRFIIFLDVVLIIMASVGFSVIIKHKKKLGSILLIILIISSGILAFNDSRNAEPLINEEELKTIQYLQNTEENAFVMSTSSYYSPWILGYSERKTIAPGLFDYDKHDEKEWNTFWTTKNLQEAKEFMGEYKKPLYVFIGQRQKDNLEQFPECFETYHRTDKNKIYEYIC